MSTICIAQKNDSLAQSEKEYFELLNYTPKNFKIDLESKPSSKLLNGNLNSLWKLKFAYELRSKLNNLEIEWLEDQINQLAVAFFLEKRPIILESVGGYSGCPDQLLRTELKNEMNITILSLCQGGCIVNDKTENFIKIFNNRIEKLLLNLNKSVDN